MKLTSISGFLFVSMLNLTSLQAQWAALNPGTSDELKQMWFFNADSGLIVGGTKAGIILKTENGSTWRSVYQSDISIIAINFPSAQKGFASTLGKDTILISENGGETWQPQQSKALNGGTYPFKSLFFTNERTGYSAGFITTDGAKTWTIQDKKLNSFPYIPAQEVFLNDSTGIIVGNEYWAEIYKTKDWGKTWYMVSIPTDLWELYSVHFANAMTGYATGLRYVNAQTKLPCIIKTEDGGETWTTVESFEQGQRINKVFAIDDNICCAVGNSGLILSTFNGGKDWEKQSSPTTNDLYDVVFLDKEIGYVCGANGTLLKTANGGVSGVHSPKTPHSITIYPNPCGSTLYIQFKAETNYPCDYKITDLTGRAVMMGRLTSHSATFNVENLRPGPYIIGLFNQEFKSEELFLRH